LEPHWQISIQKEIHPADQITRRETVKDGAMTSEQRFKRYAGMPSGPIALEGDKLDNKD
jgi:hypothetical protein